MEKYVGEKTLKQVTNQSLLRDNILIQWCLDVNAATKCPHYATYVVKTDCHDYSVKTLKYYFYTKHHLASLVQDYMIKTTISIKDVLTCNPNLTFIAILQGTADSSLNLKPLFSREENQDWIRQKKTTENIIITKDYLDYLIRDFNFQVTSITSIFFYKKCPIFNQIFKTLVTHRADPKTTTCQNQLLKKIINYSTGYFGYNQNKPGKCTHKIVSKLTKYYDITRHWLTPIGNVEKQNYFIKTCYKRPFVNQKTCLSPLPIYCCIVEYGKMRMAQILTFFDYFLIPESYRHLYSNTDNLIFAISTPTIEEAVKPHLQDWFEIEKSLIFSNTEPGFLKQEFKFIQQDEWKFISPIMQNYSILIKQNQGLHKSSVFKYTSTENSYNYSLQLLDRQSIFFSQPRRTNKIANTDIHQQNFVMKLKE